MNDFTSALVAVTASIKASDIACSDDTTVTFSADPFGPSLTDTILVSGVHPTLGLDLHYDTKHHMCQITKMDPGAPSHHLPQWRSHLRYAFVLSINQDPVDTIADSLQAFAKAQQLDNITVVVALTNDDAPNCLSAVGLPQLYSDQLWVTKRHISHTALAVIHKAITGPKFNRRHLHQQLNWNE
jgi:hypothetical protein